MRERVLARFQFAGAAPAGLSLLDACLSAALGAREGTLTEAHPLLLHPARTVLILLDDAGESDAVVLAAGALLDSQETRWRGAALAAALGPAAQPALALCDAVPTPDTVGAELLLEELIVAPHAVRLLACAERLDHARHSHLVERSALAAWVHQVREVYSPVAWRTEPQLARRFDRWAGAAARKTSEA